MLRLETATVADFAPYLGTTFALREEGNAVSLTLTEAAAHGQGSDSGRPFALLFTGPALPALPQRIYALSHPQIGLLDIFLVPISGDSRQRVYEAVFS